MSYTYTFEVVSVNEELRCMELLYKSEGLPDALVGTKLPLIDESLEDVAQRFAPTQFWDSVSAQFSVPAVGATGAVDGSISDQSAVGSVAEISTGNTIIVNEIVL